MVFHSGAPTEGVMRSKRLADVLESSIRALSASGDDAHSKADLEGAP